MISINELKQQKTDAELTTKCNEIIDSLKGFNYAERYRILTTLTDSFKDVCLSEGIDFIEIAKTSRRF